MIKAAKKAKAKPAATKKVAAKPAATKKVAAKPATAKPAATNTATAPEAAAHIFISVSRFRDLVAGGTIKHQSNGYDLATVREQYIRNAQLVMAGRGGAEGGVQLAKERALLAQSQRTGVDLKNKIASGGYIEREALLKVLQVALLNVRDKNLALGGKLADRLSGRVFTRAEVGAAINTEVRELLNDLKEPGKYIEQAANGETPDDNDGDDAT
jgi:hypothetical protein